MKEQQAHRKAISRSLEPGPKQRVLWTQAVMSHTEQFLISIPQRPAFHAAPDEGKGILWLPLTEEPQEIGPILKSLSEHVEGPGVKLGAPGYLAFIPVSTLYPAALGDYLAAVTNP